MTLPGLPNARPRLKKAAALGLFALALAPLAGCGDSGGTNPYLGGDAGGDRLVVYASDRNQVPGQFDLYIYDLDLLGFRLLRGINSGSPDLNPCLSSDGRFIAFQSDRGGGTGSDIHLYDRSRGALIALAGVNATADETEPAFTGDALKLAFVRDTLGFRRIRLIDGVLDTLVRLPGLDTLAAFSDWAPAPNQDGSVIAFVSDRNGTPDVFVWSRAQGVLDLPALRSDSTDTEPTLSGDGRYLCFASNRAGGTGGFDLYLYDLQSRQLVGLGASANSTASDRNPSLGFDGNVITFQSDRAGGLGKWDLWNYKRSTDQIGQGVHQSSAGEDIQPSLRWP